MSKSNDNDRGEHYDPGPAPLSAAAAAGMSLFQAVITGIGGLYLATGSFAVTAIAATTGMLAMACLLASAARRQQAPASAGPRALAIEQSRFRGDGGSRLCPRDVQAQQSSPVTKRLR
jgi:hypothetical protein